MAKDKTTSNIWKIGIRGAKEVKEELKKITTSLDSLVKDVTSTQTKLNSIAKEFQSSLGNVLKEMGRTIGKKFSSAFKRELTKTMKLAFESVKEMTIKSEQNTGKAQIRARSNTLNKIAKLHADHTVKINQLESRGVGQRLAKSGLTLKQPTMSRLMSNGAGAQDLYTDIKKRTKEFDIIKNINKEIANSEKNKAKDIQDTYKYLERIYKRNREKLGNLQIAAIKEDRSRTKKAENSKRKLLVDTYAQLEQEYKRNRSKLARLQIAAYLEDRRRTKSATEKMTKLHLAAIQENSRREATQAKNAQKLRERVLQNVKNAQKLTLKQEKAFQDELRRQKVKAEREFQSGSANYWNKYHKTSTADGGSLPPKTPTKTKETEESWWSSSKRMDAATGYFGQFTQQLGLMSNFGTVSENVLNSLSSAMSKLFTVAKIGTGILVGLGAAFVGISYFLKSYMQQVISVTERMKGYNIALLATMKTQTSANNLMDTALKVAEDLPIAYDQVFSSVKAYSLINPLRPMLQDTANLETNLKEINGITLALSQIEPEWGIQGAIFSLREALSGDLRSLKRRFEIPVDIITTADGERLTEVKNNPTKVVKALARYFQDIFGAEALEATSKQFGVVLAKMEGYYKQFLNMIGSAGAYDKIVGDIIKARDVIQKFVNSDSAKAYAKRFSDAMIDMWNQTRKIIDGIGAGFNTLFGTNIKFDKFETAMDFLIDGTESFLLVYQRLANLISDQTIWEFLRKTLVATKKEFDKIKDSIIEIAGDGKKHFESLTDSMSGVWKKAKEVYGWVEKTIGEKKAKQGLLLLMLFGPGNVLKTIGSVTIALGFLGLAVVNLGLALKVPFFATYIASGILFAATIDTIIDALGQMKDYFMSNWVNTPFGRMLDTIKAQAGMETSATYKFERSPMGYLIEDWNKKLGLSRNDEKISPSKILYMANTGDPETKAKYEDFYREKLKIFTKDMDPDKRHGYTERFWKVLMNPKYSNEYLAQLQNVADEQGNIANQLDTNFKEYGEGNNFTKNIKERTIGLTNLIGELITPSESTRSGVGDWAKDMFGSFLQYITSSTEGVQDLGNEMKKLSEIQLKVKSGETIEGYSKENILKMKLMADFIKKTTGETMEITSGYRAGKGSLHNTREAFDINVNRTPKFLELMNDPKFLESFSKFAQGIGISKVILEQDAQKSPSWFGKEAQDYANRTVKDNVAYKGDATGGEHIHFALTAAIKDMSLYQEGIKVVGNAWRNSNNGVKVATTVVNEQADLMTKLTEANKEFNIYQNKHKGSIDEIMLSMRKILTPYGKFVKDIETETGIVDFGPGMFDKLDTVQREQLSMLDSTKKTVIDYLTKLSAIVGTTPEEKKLYEEAKKEAENNYQKALINSAKAHEDTKVELRTRTKAIAYARLDPEAMRRFGRNPESRFAGGFEQQMNTKALDQYATLKVLDFQEEDWNTVDKVIGQMRDKVVALNMNMQEAAVAAKSGFMIEQGNFIYEFGRMFGEESDFRKIKGDGFQEIAAGVVDLWPNLIKAGYGMANLVKETAKFDPIAKKVEATITENVDKHTVYDDYLNKVKLLDDAIKDLNYTSSEADWANMYERAKGGSRSNRSTFFSEYEKSLEMAPKSLGIASQMGIQKGLSSFKNMSEIMMEGTNELVTSMASSFETGFFDLFNGNVKNMADVFAGVGKSIMNTISKIISKMISTSLTKMIFNVGVNASGSSSGGGGIMDMLSGLTGGGGSDNSGGFMNNIIGSVKNMFSSGGSSSSGGSLLGKITGVFNGGSAAKKSSGLLKGINVPALGAMAAVSFLTQPGRLFGGTVDHTEPGKTAFASLQEKQKAYQERRTDDAVKYAGASSSGAIRQWMPGAVIGRQTKSGDGIFSKKTKSFEVDGSAFSASLEGYYKILGKASEDHYSKMYELQKTRERNEMTYLEEEQILQTKKETYLANALNKAMLDKDWEAVDKYRDQVSEASIDRIVNLDAQKELKKQRRFRMDEFNQQRKNLFGGSNEIENASAVLALQKQRDAEIEEGTIAWYDSQISLLQAQQDITNAIKDMTEQARKTMVSDTMMLVKGKSGTYGEYSKELTDIRSEQLRAAGGGSDLDGLQFKYKQFFTANQGQKYDVNGKPITTSYIPQYKRDAMGNLVGGGGLTESKSGVEGYSPQYDLEGLQKYLAEEGTAIERAVMLESAKSNNADAYANIFRESFDISLDELTKTKDKMKEVANIISASKDPELISELSLFYEELNSSVISSLSGLAEQFKMMFRSGLLEGNMDIDTLRDLPNEILTSIIDTFKSDQFTGELTNKLSGLETGDNDLVRSVITDLSKFDETKGVRDEYAKLATRLDSNEDPWEVWYDYQEDTIRTKIRNSIEGNDDYYAAQDELFDLMLEKAKRVDQKAEDAFDSLEELFEDMNETAKLRLAEERKTNKGDVFYIDAMSTGLDPYTINDLKNKLKNGDKDAAGLLSEIRRKVLGTSK